MANHQELLLEDLEDQSATNPELGLILVVEDDPSMIKVLWRFFRDVSYAT